MSIHPTDEHLSNKCRPDTVAVTAAPIGETTVPRECAVEAAAATERIAVAAAGKIAAAVSSPKHPQLPHLPLPPLL